MLAPALAYYAGNSIHAAVEYPQQGEPCSSCQSSGIWLASPVTLRVTAYMQFNIIAQQQASPGQHLSLFAVLVVLMEAHQQRAHAEVVQELPRVPRVLCTSCYFP